MENRIHNFGIIGLGAIARFHTRAIESLPNARLVAVYDMVPGKAAAFSADKPGVAFYDGLEGFLAHPGLEIVTITTPSGAHMEVALEAMRAGKNVIVEKPIEITEERIDKMIDCAKRNGVVLSGIFQSRFHNGPRLVKKAIDEGRFGRISIISAQVKWYRSQEYYDKVPWHGTWKLDGGGALMNQSIHAIDLLQWFGGPIVEVSGETTLVGHENIEVEDTAAGVVRFANGAIGVIEGSTAVYPGFMKRIEVCGTKGSAVIEEDALTFWQFDEERPEDETIREENRLASSTGGASDPGAISHEGHARCFADVMRAIDTHTQPLITGEEARKAVALIRAIYDSARNGGKARF